MFDALLTIPDPEPFPEGKVFAGRCDNAEVIILTPGGEWKGVHGDLEDFQIIDVSPG